MTSFEDVKLVFPKIEPLDYSDTSKYEPNPLHGRDDVGWAGSQYPHLSVEERYISTGDPSGFFPDSSGEVVVVNDSRFAAGLYSFENDKVYVNTFQADRLAHQVTTVRLPDNHPLADTTSAEYKEAILANESAHRGFARVPNASNVDYSEAAVIARDALPKEQASMYENVHDFISDAASLGKSDAEVYRLMNTTLDAYMGEEMPPSYQYTIEAFKEMNRSLVDSKGSDFDDRLAQARDYVEGGKYTRAQIVAALVVDYTQQDFDSIKNAYRQQAEVFIRRAENSTLALNNQ